MGSSLAELLTKGTANRSPAELEEAIELLGANIQVSAGNERIVLSGSTLTKNYPETMALVEEILLEPRWDEEEFALLKQQTQSYLLQQASIPNSIAQNEFARLLYGEEHILSHNNLGNTESLREIVMDDLKLYYEQYLAPNQTAFHITWAIEQDKAIGALDGLNNNWNQQEIKFPDLPTPNIPEEPVIYFFDVPGAKQSILNFGYPALAATDRDYYPAQLMNYRLGGGSFASILTQELREGKGYTYGIRSGFNGSTIPGSFSISSGVRTNITMEAVSLIKEILESYPENYNQHDLEVTKGYMLKSNARQFETLGAKLRMLRNISNYDWSHDYVKQHEDIVNDITVEQIQELARKYLNPDNMFYVIVGDAATQLDRLEEVGLGTPVLLNNQ